MSIKYFGETRLTQILTNLKNYFANKTELEEVKTLASNPSITELNKNNKEDFWVGTKAEFDTITTKNPLVTYIVTDDDTDTGYASIDDFTSMMNVKSSELQETVIDNVNTQLETYKTTELFPIKSACETAERNCNDILTQVNEVAANVAEAAPIQNITVNGTTVPITDKTAALTIQTIYAFTYEPTASDGKDGDVWLVYEE